MKYRYQVIYEGTVYADSPEEAEDAAYDDVAEGYAHTIRACEVEPLREANEA